MGSYRELEIYQKSIDLAVEIYNLTRDFPYGEVYGITAQIRRCAVSISSNIAEGYSRGSTADYIRFLYIANGSLSELETQLVISHRLAYFDDLTSYTNKIRYIRSMLSSLIIALKAKTDKFNSSDR